jgi:hypothetical protein
MHTVWNSRGRVDEVFAKFWEGGYIGVVKIFWGGYTLWVFYCIFIKKFCKNFGGRLHFYPPSPPLCASKFRTPAEEAILHAPLILIKSMQAKIVERLWKTWHINRASYLRVKWKKACQLTMTKIKQQQRIQKIIDKLQMFFFCWNFSARNNTNI